MGELACILARNVFAGHVAAPLVHLGGLVAGTPLGSAYAQIIIDRQLDAMHGFVMLQVIDHAGIAGPHYLTGTGRFRIVQRLAVHGRNGVGHDQHVRIPAGGRRGASGDHGFLIGLARIAEMHMRVGESRRKGQPGGIDVRRQAAFRSGLREKRP